MVTLLNKITSLLVFLSCACFLQAQEMGKQPLRIGLIADIQYADKDSRGTRFYRESIPKLAESVTALNEQRVDFTVVLGDLVDEGPKDLPAVLDELDRLERPVHNLLGNHDFEKVEHPDDLYRAFRMPAPYYAVDTAGWRFVFLNTNELSAYATAPHTAKGKAYRRLAEAFEKQGRGKAQPWNGGVGKTQLTWLRKQLKQAQEGGQQVLVFTHHPLLPEDNGHEALNNRELLALLSKYKQVKAVISGHNHKGAFAMHGGSLPCITLEGMVETEDGNAYGILTISEGKLVIAGSGRMTSREFDW